LLEGIAEENSGTEEDGNDQIKRKKRLREVWNEPPSDEVAKGYWKNRSFSLGIASAVSCARGTAAQIEKLPPG
jgi:hypothetical protein